MDKKIIGGVIAALLLLVGVWLVFRGGEEEAQALAEKATGAHYAGEGTHTIEGTVTLPNPCYTLSVSAEKRGVNDVLLRFTADETAGVCAQVLHNAPFRVTFTAADNAVLSATINGAPMALDLVRSERVSAAVGEEFSIPYAEARWVEDLMITFLGIEGDSRCPVDVECIQAGWVTLRFLAGGEEFLLRVPGDAETPNAVVTGSYIITLVAVMPEAHSETPRADEDYTATIRVDAHDSKG